MRGVVCVFALFLAVAACSPGTDDLTARVNALRARAEVVQGYERLESVSVEGDWSSLPGPGGRGAEVRVTMRGSERTIILSLRNRVRQRRAATKCELLRVSIEGNTEAVFPCKTNIYSGVVVAPEDAAGGSAGLTVDHGRIFATFSADGVEYWVEPLDAYDETALRSTHIVYPQPPPAEAEPPDQDSAETLEGDQIPLWYFRPPRRLSSSRVLSAMRTDWERAYGGGSR